MRRAVLLVALMLLGGCATLGQWFSHEGRAAAPVEDSALADLADKAGLKLASHYPPGRTRLSFSQHEDGFGRLFEDSLRRQGFTLTEEGGGNLGVSFVLDSLGEEQAGQGSALWYLLVRVSDGFSFGRVYALGEAGYSPVGVMTQTPAFFAQKDAGEPVPTRPAEEWRIKPGSLRYQLAAWCGRAGYQLVWKAEHDFTMQVNAIFRDSFTGASQRLFSRMHQTGVGLRATIYQNNRVLEVVED
ncbi:TcpQ domain-containing protein [Pseudodesulfovibrio tunisiensis]|uniref:TcpQ domain-containing protein n=1 Tax=Pseudodesulfovibrio tunisiensis TaxID=463192 RepID=UPI001FB222BC|nr:TcpQ domain-containing protein [Pseudodesulfovibrio tunisiensis]